MKKKLVVLLSIVLVMCSLLCACACSHCGGKGEIPCTNSECTDGDIMCNECRGDGRINEETCCWCKGLGYTLEVCRQCQGGQVRNPITWEYFPCELCDGTMTYSKPCEKCNEEGEFYDVCTNCKGGSLGECTTCHGEGVIDCPHCQSE